MRVGLELYSGAMISWRADDSNAAGIIRLKLLRESVGLDVLPDEGECFCRIVPVGELDRESSVGIPRHGMRVCFPRDCTEECRVAVADPPFDDERLEMNRWRGTRCLLFLGMVSGILQGRCSMVHGGLMAASDGSAILICGPSGIGKSTTVSRMAGEFRVLADDCFLLYREGGGGRWMARPLPTWSSYLFGKPRMVECDARKAFPVSRLLIIGRGAPRYIPLSAKEAMLGVTNSFSDMVQWHTMRYPQWLRQRLFNCAVDAAMELTGSIPCGSLQLTLDCGISRLLPEG